MSDLQDYGTSISTFGQVLRGLGASDDTATRFDHIGMPFELLPHQRSGLHYCLYYPRAGLFFEPRTGKTIVLQMLATYYAYYGQPSVILMPGSLFLQFRQDFDGLTNHGLDIMTFNQGPKVRERLVSEWERGRQLPHVVLATPEIFKKHWRDLYHLGFRNVLFDESHRGLQSFDSLTSKTLREYVAQNPANRLVLSTGTPIPSIIRNVWSTMYLLNQSAYRSHRAFEATHCEFTTRFIPSKFGLRQIQTPSKYINLELLNKNLYAHAVYASKREVLNLEAPNIQIISCKLSATHQKLYNRVLKERMLEIEQETGQTEVLDLRQVQKLRQTALQLITHPGPYGPVKDNAVLELVEDLLQSVDVERNKVVLFANFVATNEHLAKRFEKYHPALIYGKNSADQNGKNGERFKTDPRCRLAVVNPQAGGVGYTFGKVCQTVIFVEPVSSPGIMEQAISRACLLGQTEPVLVYLIRVEKTISPTAIESMMGRIPDIEAVVGTKKSLFESLQGKVPTDVDVFAASQAQLAA